MKYLLLAAPLLLSLLACAPANTGTQGDFPMNRDRKWVLVNGDPNNERNFYWIQFDKQAPERRDNLVITEALAQRFAGGGQFTAAFGHIPGDNAVLSHVFLERDYAKDATAVNCFMIQNTEKRLTKLKTTDWFGLGKQDSPANFINKLDFKDKTYFDVCMMFDATELSHLEPNAPIAKTIRNAVIEQVKKTPIAIW